MLSVSLLQRYFDAGQFDRMVKGLVANGSPLPLPLQARLSHAAPATAMALRRLVELTYGSTGLSRQMTTVLLALQRPGGSFAGDDEADPIATAAVAAALGAVLREHGEDERVRSAYERAVLALAGMQDGRGLFAGPADRSLQDRALTSAFALSLLADDEGFRASVRFADLESWFESNQRRLEPSTAGLYRLARVRTRAAALSPALAGVAA